MNQAEQPSPREHHFYVAIAKFLFHHPEHGIITVGDPIKLKNAEQYSLSPLILYGLTVAGLPIRWTTFSSADQPRSFQDVLLEGWRYAEGLRGRPDVLGINRYVAKASPNLAREMAKIGVQVVVADAKDKTFPTALRSAQDASKGILWKPSRDDLTLAGSVRSLCQIFQKDHDWHSQYGPSGLHSQAVTERIRQWMALPEQGPIPEISEELDWEPGPWLSSWEPSLPPNQPRYFRVDGFDGSICLATGESPPEEKADGDDDFDVEDDGLTEDFYDNAAELAKNLVACWPNPPAEIAKAVGITRKELQWYLSGKASLETRKRLNLESILGIGVDISRRSLVGAGPYVLMANTPLALREAYEVLSHGGDASPCEIIPRGGAADPSWRYVLICMYGEPPSIVMAPRGAKITDRLPELFMNYEGVLEVSAEFYRDVVSTCARACRAPAVNIPEMTAFGERYQDHWIRCAWHTE